MLAGSKATPGLAQSFDCARARTPAEHAICSHAQLRGLDSSLAKSYATVRSRLSPSLVNEFVAAQRAWTKARDHGCSQAGVDCLRHAYREREDLMRALLARTSEDNPVIDSLDAAALVGKWRVAPTAAADSDRSLQPTSANLPEQGARITAKLGEICITSPGERQERQDDCSAFGLAPIPASSGDEAGRSTDGGKHDDFLTYFDGKADFELHVQSRRELVAVYRACNDDASKCERRQQRWVAASADARLCVYSVANGPVESANGRR